MTRRAAAILLAPLLSLALLTAGCDEPSYRIATVAGRITLDGQPLADAFVSFQPQAGEKNAEPGPGSFGRTDADGRYTLQLVEESEREGAIVAAHRVLISTATSTGRDVDLSTGERVPRRYRDGRLQFEVPPQGTTTADFELFTVEPRAGKK